MKTIALFIIALLTLSATSFKIRQNDDLTTAGTDAQEGMGALGQAGTDTAAAVGDAVNMGTAALNGLVGNLASGFGALTAPAAAPAAAARLQQGNGFAQALADAQAAMGATVTAINDGIESATDVVDGATQLTDQGIEAVANAAPAAAARLQQGNQAATLMADGQGIFGDLTAATEDFVNSADAAFDGTADLTEQTLSGLAGAAAPAARR
jgi:hypothetical protein